MKLTRIIPAVALSAALTVGAASAAFASDATPVSSGDVATRCDKVDDVQARIDHHQERVATLLTNLQTKRAAALAESKDRVVARLDKLISRAEKVQTRLATREQKLVDWAGTNCAPA